MKVNTCSNWISHGQNYPLRFMKNTDVRRRNAGICRILFVIFLKFIERCFNIGNNSVALIFQIHT